MTAPRLVWLRNDLRLDDHAALRAAAAGGAPVVPVYCLDPRQFGTLPSGVPKTGAHRARFLLETLHALREDLRAAGADLVVRRGRPEAVLPALARETGASAVHVHEEVAREELDVEDAVERALAAIGVRLHGHWGHTLLHPDDLPFDLVALPTVFTQFRTRVERETDVRPPEPPPARLRGLPLDAGEIPTLEALGLAPPPDDPRALFRPVGGERAGRARLAQWAWEGDHLRRYKATRDGLLAVSDASRLSPWLAIGALSPRRVWAEVRRYERERVRNESTYWLVFELLWRDYFRFVLARWGDVVFSAGGLQRLPIAWRALDDPAARADFARWTSGATGYPLVDAAMQELAATGFTSNRARQNVASFLTKNLGLDWRVGAEWFESLLVDYDVASNWGNWCYAAGVGNDARGFRHFDIHAQAERYDPDGAFVRHWLPALRGIPGVRAHRPDRLSPAEQAAFGVQVGRDYPMPMVELAASADEHRARYERAVRAVSRGRAPYSGSGRRDRRR